MGDQPDRRFLSMLDQGGDLLLRAARLMCGDWAQAEDLLQRALTRSLRDWVPRADDRTLWAEVRQNLVATYLDELADLDNQRPHRDPPTPMLLDGLDELDPPVRAAVVARHYLDLPDWQTAQVIGVDSARTADVADRCVDWLGERARVAVR